MSLLKKISILSVILITTSTVGYGATVVVPRVPVVRVPTPISRPSVSTPKPSVTKSNTSNTSNRSTITKSNVDRGSTEKNFNESSGRSSFFDSMSGAITGSWLYNSLFNNHYSSNTNDNKESSSNDEDSQSSGLWDWINNNIEYLKRVLLGE